MQYTLSESRELGLELFPNSQVCMEITRLSSLHPFAHAEPVLATEAQHRELKPETLNHERQYQKEPQRKHPKP